MKTLTTLLLTLATLTTQAQILHVTPTGAGAGTGANWANATTLETAVATATSGTSIWVQAGIYKLSATLVIPQGVSVYGGFAGTETALAQRNFAQNRTILDANNNFAGVTMEPISVLSGVTIQNGVANIPSRMNGGGVLMRAGARLEHSYIMNNVAVHRGGGIFAEDNTEIFSSVIVDNRAGVSGFAVSSTGEMLFLNNTVVGNILLDCEPFQSVTTEKTICAGETVTLSASQEGTFLWNTGAKTATIKTPALTANTTFTVKITMPNFCVVTDTFHIRVNPIPTVTINVNPPSANPFEMVTFTATATPPGGNFLWNDSGATTTPTLTVQMPATGDLQFTVNYTLNGCDALPVTATATNTDCLPPSIAGAILTADDPNLCLNETTTLRLTGGTRNSGEWILFSGTCGGVEIARTNLNNPTFTVNPTTATTFFVRGEGCGTETACVQVTVTVLLPPTITGDSLVRVGLTTQLTPSPTGGTWMSLNPATALVDATGLVRGVAAGSTAIRYTLGSCHTDHSITVLPPPPPMTGCNNNTPGWGASLGTITWGNTTNTDINLETSTTTVSRAGTPPATASGPGTQTWSGAVFATACAKGNASYGNAFNGGSAGNLNADCRQTLHTFNVGRGNGITGDLFSWCGVMRFAAELCPHPWRVPTASDFRHLHWILTGQTPPNAGGSVSLIANTYMGTSGTNASAQIGGIWRGARLTGRTNFLTNSASEYWSSTEVNASRARNLHYNASNATPELSGDKSLGRALRCVR